MSAGVHPRYRSAVLSFDFQMEETRHRNDAISPAPAAVPRGRRRLDVPAPSYLDGPEHGFRVPPRPRRGGLRRRWRQQQQQSAAGPRAPAGGHGQRRDAGHHGHRRRRGWRRRRRGRVPARCGPHRRPRRLRGCEQLRRLLRGAPHRDGRRRPCVQRPAGVGAGREALAAFLEQRPLPLVTTRSSTSIRWATPVPDYFEELRTFERTPSGNDKDRFHFTYDTEDWRRLAQSGVSAGYGAEWTLLSKQPTAGSGRRLHRTGLAGHRRGSRPRRARHCHRRRGHGDGQRHRHAQCGAIPECRRGIPRIRGPRSRRYRDAHRHAHRRGGRGATRAARPDPGNGLRTGGLHAVHHPHRTGGSPTGRSHAAVRDATP